MPALETSIPDASSPSRLPGRQLHVGRAADVGGADEEDLERWPVGVPGFRGVAPRRTSTTDGGGSLAFDHRRRRRLTRSEVAGVAEGHEDVVEGVLDGAAGGVDAHGGVVRLLVGRGDAGELGDLAAPGLRVEALAVAALALLQRGGDVHEEERAAGLLDHRAHLLAGSRRTARSGLQTATPPCRAISAATQPIRRMLVSRSSLEKVSPADRCRRTTSPSRLVTLRSPCSSSRSISARASVDLPLPDRPVKNSTSPWSSGAGWSRSTIAAISSGRSPPSTRPCTGSPAAYVATTWAPSAWSSSASPCAASGTTTTSAPSMEAAAHQRRPHQGDGGELRGAGAGEREQHDGAAAAQVLQLGVGERVDDGHEGAAGVPLADLRRREVEAAERAVLRVGEGLDGQPAGSPGRTRASGRPSGSTSSTSSAAASSAGQGRASAGCRAR